MKKLDAEKISKIMLPQRAYISFLLDMAIFSYELNVELSYLLFKKAKESVDKLE